MKTFMGNSGRHVSSNGFVNYMGPCNKDAALAAVWAEYPDAIVVDGTDDWYAQPEKRPEGFIRLLKIEILGKFHTGTSGISKSGVVLSPEQFVLLKEHFLLHFGSTLESHVRIHWPEKPVTN